MSWEIQSKAVQLNIKRRRRRLWYKSIDGGQTYTAVSKKAFDVNGKTLTNISDDNGGDSINPVLDGGTLTSTQLSVTYKELRLWSTESNTRIYRLLLSMTNIRDRF